MSFSRWLDGRIAELKESGLHRTLREVTGPQVTDISVEGNLLLNFSSNDYLGLASHPAVIAASRAAASESGAGSGASRLISGNLSCHNRLEASIATFKNTESALAFSSGYAAATGAIPALVGRGDVVILDKLAHACLVDGARLSGATIRVFPHNDTSILESRLDWASRQGGKVLVVTESVFSMDGDLAPLAEIVRLKDKYGAWLLLDEAHGVGVLGESGRGLADHIGVAERIEIQMGTLGKSLGSSGAYLCGTASLREYLLNSARSFIFSTAPGPPSVAAAEAALEVLQSPEGASRLASLSRNVRFFATMVGLSGQETPIIPLHIGDEDKAVEAMATLRQQGILVPAVRYPTVPRGKARLRVTLTAAHTKENLAELAEKVAPLSADGNMTNYA